MDCGIVESRGGYGVVLFSLAYRSFYVLCSSHDDEADDALDEIPCVFFFVSLYGNDTVLSDYTGQTGYASFIPVVLYCTCLPLPSKF